MKNKNKSAGITLIALVVTIIVLLILAGISISMLFGDNSILEKATDTKIETEKGQEQEIVALAYNSALAKKLSAGDSSAVKGSELDSELNHSVANAKNDNPITVIFMNSKRQYTINNKGEITFAGIKNEENSNISLSLTTIDTESKSMIIKATADVNYDTDLSIDELSQYFIDAMNKKMQTSYSSWSEYATDYESWSGSYYEDIKDYYDNSWEKDSGEYSDVYDFVYKVYPYEIVFSCNGETKTGTYAEFTVTKPGTYTVTATYNEYTVEQTWNDYVVSKSEEFSPIQNSNYKLSMDGYEVWIPAGFAYGTSENVGNVATGLVITDSVEEMDSKNYSNGNEFVWIPIDKTNLTVGKTNKKMAEISSGTDYRGIIYNWKSDQTGNETFDPSLGVKEPAYLTYSDSYSEINATELQQEYNNLIASIMEYGGFYVARYEMGESSTNISRMNVTPVKNLNWWNAYSKAKTYNKNGITSGMIWGSQWDAILNFGLTNMADSSKVTADNNGNHSYTILNTGIWLGTNSQTDKINNIFDLEGNVREWTMTAAIDGDGSSWSTSRRIIVGGSAKYTGMGGATQRGNYYPGDTEDSYLYGDYFCTRIMFYINV